MKKNGLQDELSERLNSAWDVRDDPEACAKAHGDIVVTLDRINTAKDIHLFIQSEKAILLNELERYANSPEMVSSLNAGLEGLEAAQGALGLAQDSEGYQLFFRSIGVQSISGGLPLDAFRSFIKSHQTRLRNLLVTGIPVSAKSVIRKRQSNLKLAEALYMNLQRKVLGLPEKDLEKSKGRG